MYITDLQTGKTRLYGTNPHDSLVKSDDGRSLHYYNLQCGEGSKYGDFRFTDENGVIPGENKELLKYGADDYFNIGGFLTPEKIPEYLNDHGEVIVEKEVWEDAKKALDVWNKLFTSYEELTDKIEKEDDIKNATKRIDEWCIEQLKTVISDYYADLIINTRETKNNKTKNTT